ncbi:unnamed protein product [Alopecurus aequalis]
MAGNGALVMADKNPSTGTADLQSAPVVTESRQMGKAVEADGASSSATAGDTVAAMMQKLNLTQQEATPFVLDDEGDDDLPCPDWALVGKVLTPNVLHVNTIKSVVLPAWGNPKDLEVRPMGPNMFLAEFGSEADRSRVAKGGPWCIGRHAILLKEFDPRIKPDEVVFNELPIWARIMNLGYGLMNSERGIPLASRLGKVERAEVDENGRAWGSFLRVRVSIDASEPIMRCVSVHSKKMNHTFHYDVMYEKLPIYCFSCGRLGHSSLLCPTPAERNAEGKLSYDGGRLCVPDRKKYEGGGSVDRSQSSKASWSGTDRGSGSKSATPEGRKKQGDGQGEVTSPVKKNTRARKQTAASKGQRAGSVAAPKPGYDLVQGRVTGQKRKHTKQVYRAKASDCAEPSVNEQQALALAVVPQTIGRENETPVDESHKKQKTDISRSADPAAAARQPRHSQ